jgi:hypothetical protein
MLQNIRNYLKMILKNVEKLKTGITIKTLKFIDLIFVKKLIKGPE